MESASTGVKCVTNVSSINTTYHATSWQFMALLHVTIHSSLAIFSSTLCRWQSQQVSQRLYGVLFCDSCKQKEGK